MMNRNTNAHFFDLPKADIRRSKFDRSHSFKFSGNVGDVIPIYVDPQIMPGDTVSIKTSKVIRFQTMLSPVMDNIRADIYWAFVPHRLIHDHFPNIMGENTSSAWIPNTTFTVPKISVPPTGSGSNNYRGSILDYLGYPVELTMEDPNNPGTMIPAQTTNVEVSAYPLRAYCKFCLDWMTNENITDPINLYTGDSTVTCTTGVTYVDDVPHGGKPFKAMKLRDYFTSCLPGPQKGSAVSLPLGTKAPVYPTSNVLWKTDGSVKAPNDASEMYFSQFGTDNTINVLGGRHNLEAAAGYVEGSTSTLSDTSSRIIPNNLWADLSVATAANVNDLRFAFQLQKLLEKDARSGSRMIETIRSHFGVDAGDARLQRSEYLGGNSFPVVVNQVANTAQTSSDPLGDLGAYSCTVDVNADFTKSFVEWGTLLCCMVLRYEHTYCQGLAPFWHQDDRLSFYWPVFASLGELPVAKDALFLGATGTFGFQEAWAEYRYQPNRCANLMRPYVSGSLSAWTLADDYSSAPSLSDSWIREDLNNVDRTLSVTSQTSDQFWADVYFKADYVRPMPVYSVPGLIDHF